MKMFVNYNILPIVCNKNRNVYSIKTGSFTFYDNTNTLALAQHAEILCMFILFIVPLCACLWYTVYFLPL